MENVLCILRSKLKDHKRTVSQHSECHFCDQCSRFNNNEFWEEVIALRFSDTTPATLENNFLMSLVYSLLR
jgi:hypothetical protein